MKLKILLPFQVFAEISDVKRIVAETPQGSFGLLPHRLDCVAVLATGILTFETDQKWGFSTASTGEVYVAVDEGVLVKTGRNVLVSVRNAIGGMDLGKLREAVEREFVNLDESEKQVRTVLARMESGFLRRFAEFHRG